MTKPFAEKSRLEPTPGKAIDVASRWSAYKDIPGYATVTNIRRKESGIPGERMSASRQNRLLSIAAIVQQGLINGGG